MTYDDDKIKSLNEARKAKQAEEDAVVAAAFEDVVKDAVEFSKNNLPTAFVLVVKGGDTIFESFFYDEGKQLEMLGIANYINYMVTHNT